jgi:hypothetical protein
MAGATQAGAPGADHQRAVELQRRQVALAVAAAAVFVVTLVVVAVAIRATAHEPVRYVFSPDHQRVRAHSPSTAPMLWALGAGLLATFALLVALIVHAARVASFAFRREVS